MSYLEKIEVKMENQNFMVCMGEFLTALYQNTYLRGGQLLKRVKNLNIDSKTKGFINFTLKPHTCLYFYFKNKEIILKASQGI